MSRGRAPGKKEAKRHRSSATASSGPPAGAAPRTPDHPVAAAGKRKPARKPRGAASATGRGGLVSGGDPSRASQGAPKKPGRGPASTEAHGSAPESRAEGPGPSSEPAPRGRGGRPKGPRLTGETLHIIVNCIRAGGYDYVAAEAVGISERTFRDWIRRGEGTHPSRRSTALHRRLAQEVRKARAEARLAAETTVHQTNPPYWLAHVARSKPGREGWTDPGPEGAGAAVPGALAGALSEATLAELEEAIEFLDRAREMERSRRAEEQPPPEFHETTAAEGEEPTP